MHTHPLQAPRYGIGMHPRWVQTAEHTSTWVFPAGFRQTSLSESRSVDLGYSFYSWLYSSSVSLLMKTGVPFQTIWRTSPGGISEMSTSRQVFLSYLVQPLSLPMRATAQSLPRLAMPAQQRALSMQIWVLLMSVQCSLWILFSSNQLSILALKSMWSPKLPGLAEVTKKLCLSGMEWLLLSFLEARQLYQEISPKPLEFSECHLTYC